MDMTAAPEMPATAWDRVASDYFSEVVSPFAGGACLPLLRLLDRIPAANRKVAADFGCGTGPLLADLAARFRRVYAVDFSAGMLAQARARCPRRHVSFHRADLADLRRFRGKIDVAVTVNAVLTPDEGRLERIFHGLRESLTPRGQLMGIFPAMEPVLYQGYLIHQRERRVRHAGTARAVTSRILERNKYDFVHGTYREDDAAQKFFYGFELPHRLRRAGFRRIKLSRVTYPWDDRLGGYEQFPGEPPMWDWLVRASA
jgi:SAM-dependent methyltransferase